MPEVRDRSVGVAAAFATRFARLRLVSDRLPQLGELAARVIFPAILIGMVCNQQEWSGLLLVVGRLSSAVAVLCSAVIVADVLHAGNLVAQLAFGLVVMRVARAMSAETTIFVAAYTALYAILFCVAGGALLVSRPRLVYRQAMIFCAISAPFMLLQILGVGDWTQILRTDIHSTVDMNQVPTLFVAGSELISITTLQARPAGIMWANNVISVIIMFVLALQFALFKGKKLNRFDLLVGVVAVLAMAKIVFVTVALLVGKSLLSRDHDRKGRALRFAALILVLIVVYTAFFPGLSAANLSWQMAWLNLRLRWWDLAASQAVAPELAEGETPAGGEAGPKSLTFTDDEGVLRGHLVPAEAQSGYAVIAAGLPYVLVVAFLLAPWYVAEARRFAVRFPELAAVPWTFMVVAVLVPLVTSMLETSVFWFFAGGALLPVVLKLWPYPDGQDELA